MTGSPYVLMLLFGRHPIHHWVRFPHREEVKNRTRAFHAHRFVSLRPAPVNPMKPRRLGKGA